MLSLCLLLQVLLAAGQAVGGGDSSASAKPPAADAAGSTADTVAVTGMRDVFLSKQGRSGPYGTRVEGCILSHPFVRMDVKSVGLPHLRRNSRDLDWVFYVFSASLLLLGLTRVLFPGYLEAMFLGFFGFSNVQRKMADGMVRHGVASLWLNLLFVLNGAIFLFFLFRATGGEIGERSPLQWIGLSVLLITAVYLLKYGFLLLSGWVFGKVKQAHGYMSVVFQVNRMAGILLLLAALPLALSGEDAGRGFMPLVWVVLSLLLAYRLFRSFEYFRRALGAGPVRFLLLFLSFEALPLLLLRKALTDLFL